MARYGSPHQILMSDTIKVLKDQMIRDVFDGVWAPTKIKVFGEGVIDPFTEEISFSSSGTYYNASGIVGKVTVSDTLLGIGGRVRVGDVSILYPYDIVSGLFLSSLVQEIQLNVPGLSGHYFVNGHEIGELSGEPVLIKFGLSQDRRV